MAIFDNNWKSYSNYVIATVESSRQWNCVEKGLRLGIGVMQWSIDRSWQLLNMIAIQYPNETKNSLPSLWERIKEGSVPWGKVPFTTPEISELENYLGQEHCIEVQRQLMDKDMEEKYIPILKEKDFSDPKGSIFALSVQHQSPRQFNIIYNQIGSSTLDGWYNGAMNNSVLYKYKTRHNTIKGLLDEWNGESGVDGWGSIESYEPETSDKNEQEEDKQTLNGKIEFNKIEQHGKDLFLRCKLENKEFKIPFYRGSANIWFPRIGKEKIDVSTPEIKPETGGGGTGTNEQLDKICQLMESLEGKMWYSQESSQRTNIPISSDCSGLTWWLYQQIGINIGSWTEGQLDDQGRIVTQGSGKIPIEQLQKGDLILMNWGSASGRRVQHVEMYIGNNTNMGHGGVPAYGPTKKQTDIYGTYGVNWYIKRYIEL